MANQVTNRWNVNTAWIGATELSSSLTIECVDGVITAIEPGHRDDAEDLDGFVLPGLVNTHSHAFHRLLRGRTHRQGGDFWLWREHMYELAAALTPERYEALATAVYVEMALAGVTAVGEFHYLHHQSGGTPYTDPNEMGHALVRAARTAGLRICLLDAGYFRAGFDEQPLDTVQERFRDASPEKWIERVAELADRYDPATDVTVGLAPHSVRAVSPAGLRLAASDRASMPVHVHVSEQPAENRDCLEATSLTPTALLADAGLLTAETTLVHATHVTGEDIETIGSAGAGVCYCATTERDLADGIGPVSDLFYAGARLSVGSDSHAVIDLFEEARGMEMHARLASGRRGVLAPVALLAAATTGGATSLGFETGRLAVGAPADLIAVDAHSPRLAGAEPTPDSLVFSATAADVTDVLVGGRRIVAGGRHEAWDEARSALELPTPGR